MGLRTIQEVALQKHSPVAGSVMLPGRILSQVRGAGVERGVDCDVGADVIRGVARGVAAGEYPPVVPLLLIGRADADAEGIGRALAEAEGTAVTQVVFAVGGLGYIMVPAGQLVVQAPRYGNEPWGHVATQVMMPV